MESMNYDGERVGTVVALLRVSGGNGYARWLAGPMPPLLFYNMDAFGSRHEGAWMWELSHVRPSMEAIMQSNAKRNSIVTHEIADNGDILIHVLHAGTVRFDPEKVHEDNRTWAEYHGWIQRLSDGAAKSRNPETGAPATPEEKMAAVQRLADHYMSGTDQWNLTAVAGVGADDSITVRAVAEVKGITPERVRELLEVRAKALNVTVAKVLYAIRTSDGPEGSAVRDAMARMRKPSDINASEVLAGLAE